MSKARDLAAALNSSSSLIGASLADPTTYAPSEVVGAGVTVAANTTALNFKAKTGDANSVDIMTVTHGSGKGKEFMKQIAELVADHKPVPGMVVIADDMRSIVMPHDEASIASVAPTFDGA